MWCGVMWVMALDPAAFVCVSCQLCEKTKPKNPTPKFVCLVFKINQTPPPSHYASSQRCDKMELVGLVLQPWQGVQGHPLHELMPRAGPSDHGGEGSHSTHVVQRWLPFPGTGRWMLRRNQTNKSQILHITFSHRTISLYQIAQALDCGVVVVWMGLNSIGACAHEVCEMHETGPSTR